MGKKDFTSIILNIFLVLATFVLVVYILSEARSFLVPFVTAIILALIMNPIHDKLMSWKVPKILSIIIVDLIIVCSIAGILFLISAQVAQVANNWDSIETRLKPQVEKVKNTFSTYGFVEEEKDKDWASSNNPANGSSDSLKLKDALPYQKIVKSESFIQKFSDTLANVLETLSSLVLILVYVFFFLLMRNKFQKAVLGFFSDENKDSVKKIIAASAVTAQNYLLGRFTLILILSILYSILYTSIGLKYGLLVALIGALCSMIPYVGNLVGLGLALTASFVSEGGSEQALLIFMFFWVIQFIENNILEPYVVGQKVNLNPLVVIIGILLGGSIWGVMGMLLAIPILGICREICKNIDTLQPIAYLIDDTDVGGKNGFMDKIKSLFRKIKSN